MTHKVATNDLPTEPEGNFCWSCGEEILNNEEWYPDPKTPPLDEDDCLCKGCCIAHLDDVIEEHEDELKLLKIKKEELESDE